MPNKTIIAVVDDDASVRDALTGLMRSLGYGVIAFGSAEDFLKSPDRPTASCLITDVQMPGMSGPELYDRLVADGEQIPTVLITAFPDSSARQRALQAGVMCYLSKPFREDELLDCIHSVVGP